MSDRPAISRHLANQRRQTGCGFTMDGFIQVARKGDGAKVAPPSRPKRKPAAAPETGYEATPTVMAAALQNAGLR
jgi:hypothetical protein